jgi:LacI family transcriptional regulator
MPPPQPIRHVTLRKIAAAAGVSHTAVSLALRNDRSVAAATRERIRKIARNLGYRPDPFVSALLTRVRTGRTPRLQAKLAFVIPCADIEAWKSSWTNLKFRAGARARAAELGFEMEDFHPAAEGITYSRLSGILWSRGIRGVVLSVFPHFEQGAMDMKWGRFAAAAQGYAVLDPELHRSCHFHWDGMTQACERLHALGYRRLGFAMAFQASWRVRHFWLGAFQAYHAALGVTCLPPHLNPTHELDRRAFLRWRKRHAPDVVLTVHAEIEQWLLDEGLRVPENIGLAHLDRHEEAMPSWAGVDQNARAVGARASDLVIEQLKNNEYGVPKRPKVVLTRGVWIAGRSVRASGQASRKKTRITSRSE